MAIAISPDAKPLSLKILVVGDSGCGKTAFVQRYVNGVYQDAYKSSVGADFFKKTVLWHDKDSATDMLLTLQFWDIAGQDRYHSMTRVYFRDAHAALVLFDLSTSRTFENVSRWKADIDNKCRLQDGSPIPCVLLGNKSDLRVRDVSQERVESLSNRAGFVGWAEASVKQNIFVDETVTFLLEHLIHRLNMASHFSPPPSASLGPQGGQVISIPSEVFVPKNSGNSGNSNVRLQQQRGGRDHTDSSNNSSCC